MAELLEAGHKVVVLQAGKARLFYDGNPVVFGGAVQNVLGKPKPAAGVFVTDHNGKVEISYEKSIRLNLSSQ